MPTDDRRRSNAARRASLPLPPLDPKLERTLLDAGWRPEDLRSPRRSPLAELRVSDLAASLVAPAPDGTWTALAKADPNTADPNDTRLASDWTWMDSLAAMSGADPQHTLITPARRQTRPAADLDRTRIAPWTASDLIPSVSPAAPDAAAQPEATATAPSPALPQLPEVPEQPALMAGVQLLGTLRDTGFAEQQWLAQRGPDFVQLSELLYRVLEQVDGTRTLEEIAARARETTGRPVSANNVRLLIAARLLPLGLIVPVEGAAVAPAPSTTRSPLAITLRLGFLGPKIIEPFARVLQVFFWPPLLVALVLAIAASQAWLFFIHGAAAPIQSVLARPLVLVAISAFVLLSAVSHEFGHASALRYGGGRARGIGFGVYFIYPAFYTDCTESYRLSRWGRMRTDLGGIYFDLLLTLALVAAYVLTRQELLLATVILIDLEIMDQFSPIMRYDGYWALADLVGVPDFLVLIKPVLRDTFAPLVRRVRQVSPLQAQRGASPDVPAAARAPGASAPALKGWVRVVFLGYTAVTVPFLLGVFALLLIEAPIIAGFYRDSLLAQLVAARLPGQTAIAGAIAWVQVGVLVLTAAMILYGIVNLVRSLIRGAWVWGSVSRQRRIFSLVALVAGAALLALAWYNHVVVPLPQFSLPLGH